MSGHGTRSHRQSSAIKSREGPVEITIPLRATPVLRRALNKLKGNPRDVYRCLVPHPHDDVEYLNLMFDETIALFDHLNELDPTALRAQGIIFSRTDQKNNREVRPSLYSKGGGFCWVWYNNGGLPKEEGMSATDFFRGSDIAKMGREHRHWSMRRAELPASEGPHFSPGQCHSTIAWRIYFLAAGRCNVPRQLYHRVHEKPCPRIFQPACSQLGWSCRQGKLHCWVIESLRRRPDAAALRYCVFLGP